MKIYISVSSVELLLGRDLSKGSYWELGFDTVIPKRELVERIQQLIAKHNLPKQRINVTFLPNDNVYIMNIYDDPRALAKSEAFVHKVKDLLLTELDIEVLYMQVEEKHRNK